MKIMILVATYYPLQDGVQMVTQYIAEGLAKNNEVLVLTSLRKGMDRVSVHNGVKIERIIAQRNPYTLCMKGEKSVFRKKIFEFNPDILMVVGIQTWTFDWLKRKLKKFPGKKVLYTHGCSLPDHYNIAKLVRSFRIRKQIMADLMKIYAECFWKRYTETLPKYIMEYDKVIYLYNKDKLYLRMKPYTIEKEFFLGNAVDKTFFSRKAFLTADQETLSFINVSSYVENKNQELILRAYYEAAIPDSKLVLIGSQETEYYNYLVNLNEKLKQECKKDQIHVEIHCGISREKTMEIYKKANVYIVASNTEVMSISLCEAAAAGLSILSTDVGHASNVPGVCICSSKEEFIYQMRLLYENPHLRYINGKLSYEYALKHYVIENKVSALEEQLIQLLGGDEDNRNENVKEH